MTATDRAPAGTCDPEEGALTPAQVRAAMQVAARYTEAYAYHLAEEQSADAVAVPTVDDMVAARLRDLTATPETHAGFLSYLDQLEQTHGHEPAMAAYISTTRARLGADSSPSHLEVA
ncbi:hypothetical protein BJF79_47795 [Actinomadura sp. CNU-125]|uniref:hypothetical protein n=1 Tax=Actinomadura sp. CNU-125 TaxID=1904961 RepID=UPI0009660AF1|nr:hypothetical protein [Actinomadura sp. CNU-125]OLT19413.1 hypothetical protein BJF79_47795 [Actinomadura sp. CNU-125]